jgi:hypothetical protein
MRENLPNFALQLAESPAGIRVVQTSFLIIPSSPRLTSQNARQPKNKPRVVPIRELFLKSLCHFPARDDEVAVARFDATSNELAIQMKK